MDKTIDYSEKKDNSLLDVISINTLSLCLEHIIKGLLWLIIIGLTYGCWTCLPFQSGS